MKQGSKLLLLFTLFAFSVKAQNVGIGTSFPHPSSQLDISSNNKGILIPRLLTAQRLSIQTPVAGLMVYDANLNSFWYHDGSKWNELLPQVQRFPSSQRTVPMGGAGDRFGAAVASGGSHIAVGAPSRNAAQGSVFFGSHQLGNTYHLDEYTGSGYTAGDQFGFSVAVDKETGGLDWIGGAPFDNNVYTDQGSVTVYYYLRTPRKLYSPSPQTNENFGAAVDITGQSYFNDQYIIVGAPGRNSGTGGAYIFWYNGSNFVLMQTINPVTPNAADSFGHAVSIFYNRNNGEGWAFVGAPKDDIFYSDDGSVSVYKRNTAIGSWDFQFRMTSGSPMAGGRFGTSIAANLRCSSGIAIGEPGYSTTGYPNIGRVYYSFLSSSNIFQNPVLIETGDYANSYLGCSLAAATDQQCSRSYLVLGSKAGAISSPSAKWGVAKYFMLLNNSGSWIGRGQSYDPEGNNGWQFGFSVGVNSDGRVIVGSPEAVVGNNVSQGKLCIESFV